MCCASPGSNRSCTGDAMTAMKFEDQDIPDLDEYVIYAGRFIPAGNAIASGEHVRPSLANSKVEA